MSMNVEQILTTVYATQFAQGLFGMADYNDGKGVVIQFWNVPNVPQPTQEQILAMDTPQLEQQYLFNQTYASFVPQLAKYIDTVAQGKQYDDGVSCASYFNSTVTQWKNEATTFIAWRDAVYNYAIAQYALMESGQRTVPTFPEFQSELPVITWPD
jgi:hypothetical protein